MQVAGSSKLAAAFAPLAVLVALASSAAAQRPAQKLSKPATTSAPAPAVAAPAVSPAPAPSTFAGAEGSVVDSVHNVPLVGASVQIEGTNRGGMTGEDGRYRIDSIPPGAHRIAIGHALIDTLGISLVSQPITFTAGETRTIDLAIPSAERLVSILCPPAVLRAWGPGALIGFVRDPDSGEPAVGTKVQLVYEQADPLGLKKTPRVREVAVDSAGNYRICGVPADMDGKVQVFSKGVSSGEVPATIDNGFLGLRSLSIVSQHRVVAVTKTDSAGKATRFLRGSARVRGKVVNKTGQPLGGARVTVTGTGLTTLSRPNGDFVLDSLPSGTQSVEVRKLGYAATDVAVELNSTQPASVRVAMEDFVPTLATMRVEAERDKGLMDVGYLQRKQTGLGYYMDGKVINKDALTFSDAMRVAPGLHVVPTGDGRTYQITSTRDPTGNGCVNFYVDGSYWREMSPGDIDQFVRPEEITGVEIYSSATAPPQFVPPGSTNCATVVVWTVARTGRSNARKK